MTRGDSRNKPADPPVSTITIGPDGRVYMQEVTIGLLTIAVGMNSSDVQLQARMASAVSPKKSA
jgi:hypothetical protein